ncbi:MAG: hypothetical protein AMXMBFR44_6410 [Candidatus Campbellbacteria bacterium]
MNTQKGFGAIAVIGILAAISLLGGGIYVATQSDASVEVEDGATTTKRWFEINPRFEEEMTSDANVDVDASTSVEVNTNGLLQFEGETNADGSVTNY